jgi:hypothetical protein
MRYARALCAEHWLDARLCRRPFQPAGGIMTMTAEDLATACADLKQLLKLQSSAARQVRTQSKCQQRRAARAPNVPTQQECLCDVQYTAALLPPAIAL